MKNIHSSLLKPMPMAVKPRRSRTPLRLSLVIFLAALVVVPIFIISTRVLPEEGIGKVFYWFHDHIFLPIKGFTYTLFYPYSISWWGMLLTVLAAWLAAYLLMVSFTRDPHIYLLQRIVRRNVRHRFLVTTSRWLKKMRLQPVLLKAVVEMERKRALHRLAAVPVNEVNEGLLKRVVCLTRLSIDLTTLAPVTGDETWLEAVVCWHEAYLQVRIRQQENPGSQVTETLTSGLAADLEKIVLPLFSFKDSAVLTDTWEKKTGFDTGAVMLALLFLASLHNDRLAGCLPGISPAGGAEAVKNAVAARLASSTAQRRAFLDEIRRRLERGNPDTEISILEPYRNHKPFTLSAVSGLGLSTALDLSGLVGDVSIGLGYIESLELLDFTLYSLDPEDPRLAAVQSFAPPPGPVHYRLCAELLEKEIAAYEETWKQSDLDKDGLIAPADFELARTRVRALYHAAGPGLDRK